jgi:hypothetical protein
MGLFDLLNIIEDYGDSKAVIEEGLQEALDTMEGMCANEGQLAVFESFLAPEFEAAAGSNSPTEGWSGVDAGPYSDFMGEIAEAGNQIMEAAYDYAQEILAQQEDYDEDAIEELGDEAEADL